MREKWAAEEAATAAKDGEFERDHDFDDDFDDDDDANEAGAAGGKGKHC